MLNNRNEAKLWHPSTQGTGPSLKRSPVTGSIFKSPCACAIKYHSIANNIQHAKKLNANIVITYLHCSSIWKIEMFPCPLNAIYAILELNPKYYQSCNKIFEKSPSPFRYINELNISFTTFINHSFRLPNPITLKMGISSVSQALHTLISVQFNWKNDI